MKIKFTNYWKCHDYVIDIFSLEIDGDTDSEVYLTFIIFNFGIELYRK